MTSYLKEVLPDNLYYHGFHHTMDVMENAMEIAKAEKISKTDLNLLKIAVLFHDAGFTVSYDGHEEISCDMAKKILPKYNLTNEEIDIICGMIRSTKIPQKPKTILDKIIADADLMYLGTNRFEEIGETLFQEMQVYFGLTSEKKWNEIQKKFIEKHHFHTTYCREHFEAAKQNNLKKVLAYLSNHQ